MKWIHWTPECYAIEPGINFHIAWYALRFIFCTYDRGTHDVVHYYFCLHFPWYASTLRVTGRFLPDTHIYRWNALEEQRKHVKRMGKEEYLLWFRGRWIEESL